MENKSVNYVGGICSLKKTLSYYGDCGSIYIVNMEKYKGFLFKVCKACCSFYFIIFSCY